jgi:hypothetical protein
MKEKTKIMAYLYVKKEKFISNKKREDNSPLF